MSVINDLLNSFFGSRVEPRRFNDIDQIDTVTGLFNQLVAKQVAEQQRRTRLGRNPRLFDRTGGLDR
jgi:hypothetical protein